MGKANKVKKDLGDAVELVDLLQTLKDIADNKFFTLMSKKEKFRRFGATFIEFFRMISFTDAKHPLISNKNKNVGILAITIEGSFLGEFNNKILRRALAEKENHEEVTFIAVGRKAADRLLQENPYLKIFTNMESIGLYETAVTIKDYLVEQIMTKKIGKVIVVYSYPKSLETQKQRILKLLPCDELLTKQLQFQDDFESVIEESDPNQVIGFLSNLWITTRIYEILVDTTIASAAAQSQFLDDSVDKMNKEKKKTAIMYRKAKKSDIDKSLRETFSARMMTMK